MTNVNKFFNTEKEQILLLFFTGFYFFVECNVNYNLHQSSVSSLYMNIRKTFVNNSYNQKNSLKQYKKRLFRTAARF